MKSEYFFRNVGRFLRVDATKIFRRTEF